MMIEMLRVMLRRDEGMGNDDDEMNWKKVRWWEMVEVFHSIPNTNFQLSITMISTHTV